MNNKKERPDLDNEEPIISIVWDDEERPSQAPTLPPAPKPRNWAAKVCAVLLLLIVAGGALWGAWHFFYLDLPVSTSFFKNVAKLKKEAEKSKAPGVVVTQDSIHGVALNIYRLRGLQATLSLQEPSPADSDVVLYSRSADYTAEGTYLGDLVIDGQEKKSMNDMRLGYCGMANGNVVIGVSPFDCVMDYCIERGGSFFRQFALLSDGELPRKFSLHGRVERCALARTDDDQLFYIATRHKELLLDFANALRAYGFADAIYITGGTSYSYYRNSDGDVVGIGDPNEHPLDAHMPFVPWLVFRAR